VQQVKRQIPIVTGGADHLVGAGLIASLAERGGNITGSTLIAPDLSGKRLEVLKGCPRGVAYGCALRPES